MYCIHCGQPRPLEAAFCPHCGRALSTVELPPRTAASLPATRIPSVPWRGGHVAWGILFVAILQIPVSAVAIGIGSLVDGDGDAVAVWVSVHLMGLGIVGVVWRLGLYRYGTSLWVLGLAPMGLPKARTAFLTIGALVASLVATFMYAAMIEAVGWDILLPPEHANQDIVFSGVAALLTFQALAMVTPLTEELFFRGFVFSGLVRRFGVGWAIVGSAVVFSLFHVLVGVGVVVPIFITGLLLAWLYRQTGSIWPSIVAHGGQNTLAVLAILYWV